MTKLGESHPPPGAAKPKRGWRSLGTVVATLLGPKMELHRHERRWPSDEALSRSNDGERGASCTIVYWMRGGRGISCGVPISHAAKPEWLWRSDRGLGGTLRAMERCMAGWGKGPISVDRDH